MRFRLRTLLLFVAFAGICLGGMVWRWNFDQGRLNWFYRTGGIVSVSPYWIPVVFSAYVIGRREMTVAFICSFAVAEATAVWAVIRLFRMLSA
jgi:hypothetical protein